jgi:RNA recognition motif-containing protein
MDRFTFYNNCNAFVELANEEQAERAVQLLESNESLGKQVYVKRLGPEYKWGLDNGKMYKLGHTVLINDAGLEAAIQPILDGRRLVFSVLPPAWADLDAPISTRNDINRDILVRTLEPFGLESHSPISPNWGDKKQTPRYLCFVDMKTKQGADEAIRKLHGTTVQGLKVGLEQSKMAPWKAYQLGKADKTRLELLQEKGLAPPPEEIDEEQYSQPFVRKSPRGARR